MQDEEERTESRKWNYKEIGRKQYLPPSPNFSKEVTGDSTNTNSMNKIQGYILIGIAGVTLALLGWFILRPGPKYVYKVINVQAQFNKGAATTVGSSENSSKLNATNVNLSDEELSLLGKEGWELVDTILEMETTHPNYGNAEYVTGMQPNIRPQRAVLLFKKQL